MAGTPWGNKEADKLIKVIEKEKKRANKIGVKINWKRITKKLNDEYNNNRSEKAAFWYYNRLRREMKLKDNGSVPTRSPRPMNASGHDARYEPVFKPETFVITATDEEGNVVFNLMVKNTGANVSRMLSDVAFNLNVLKDKTNES